MTSGPHDSYPSIGSVWKSRYGSTVRRISLDPGFGCPNRDEDGVGCVFCDAASFSPSAGDVRPVRDQLISGINRLSAKGVSRFAAYFQPHTNTYAPVESLRETFAVVREFEEVVALCVGTRPDCVGEGVMELIDEHGREREVWLELGLQTRHDRTLELLGRGHDSASFADAVTRAKKRDVFICAHVILGLPGETPRDEEETARFLAGLRVDGIKLHQLSIVKGTQLEKAYAAGELSALDEEEYVDRAAAFVSLLHPSTIIHRLVGDIGHEKLIAPSFNKGRAAMLIRQKLP